MANNAEALSRRVLWTQLFQHLGLTYGATSLPALVDCPLCKGKLRVYRDFLLNSEWLYCHDCSFAGDTIEFAAAVWKVEVVEAVARLQQEGLLSYDTSEESIDRYLDQIIGLRVRLRKFEKNSIQRIATNKTDGLSSLLQNFMLDRLVKEGNWQEQDTKLVWGATCREVEDLVHPGSYEVRDRENRNEKSSKRRGPGPGGRRLFKDKDWSDVLVVPYCDLPGRVCALAIIGGDADPENDDVLFKPLNIGGSRREIRECGVSPLLNLIGKPHKDFGDTLFVIADPVVALRLQLRWLRDFPEPLPIVSSVLDERFAPQHVFDQLPPRELIFWGPQRDHRLLRQAVSAGGKVSPLGVTPRQIHRRFERKTSKIWLNEMASDAVPWPEAIANDLASMDDFAAQNLLSGLGLTARQLESLSAEVAPESRVRLERLVQCAVRRRRALINNRAIIESSDGWCYEESQEEVCNGIVRVERIVRTDSGRTYYSGWAKTASTDTRTHFVLDSELVHKRGLLPLVRDKLLADRASKRALIFNSRIAKDSLNIALKFSEPITEHGTDGVGWHAEESCFAFPQFSLGIHGEDTSRATIFETGQPLPAANWAPPFSEKLNKDTILTLSENKSDVALLWAVAACVAEQLLAYPLHAEQHPVVIKGSSATAGFAAAEALGCIRYHARSRGTKMDADDIVAACDKHSLPALMPIRNWSEAAIEAVCSRRTDSIIISGNCDAVRALQTQGRWHVIYSGERVQYIRPEVAHAAQQLLPNYLRHVLQQDSPLKSSYPGEPFIRRVLGDMANWMESCSLDSETSHEVTFNSTVIRRANKLLTPAGIQSPVEHFTELVQKFAKGGDLSITSEPIPATGSLMQLHVDSPNGRVWIPRGCVSRVLSSKNSPPIDTQAIEADMQERSVLADQHGMDDEDGWLVVLDELWSIISPKPEEAEVLSAAAA